MAQNFFTSLDISSQGMSLQRARLSAVANNIANVNTTKGADGKVYQREIVVAKKVDQKKFSNFLDSELSLSGTDRGHGSKLKGGGSAGDVLHFTTEKDSSPPRLIYDPSHPDAREDGYLETPNINIVTEMVEMMTAQRAFDANVQVADSAKNIAKYSLEI
jgi:flagellar basal-body rod protein FlgC